MSAMKFISTIVFTVCCLAVLCDAVNIKHLKQVREETGYKGWRDMSRDLYEQVEEYKSSGCVLANASPPAESEAASADSETAPAAANGASADNAIALEEAEADEAARRR